MSAKIVQIENVNVNDLAAIIATKVLENVNKRIEKQYQEKEFLTRKQVSEYLNVSLVTLHHWDKKGILVPQKIGRKVRYLKTDILNALSKDNE